MPLGVLAFGDSITNGGGELQWGVALQSWALWTARGLGLPYSGFATDGARVGDVVGVQLPRWEATAPADASYDVGCLYIGVNDVRGLDWDRAAFASGFHAALSRIAPHCDRLLTATVPLRLGLPPAGAKVAELNSSIEEVAGEVGALVVDLRRFRGRRLLMADQVHPTAFGQLAIACAALDVLARDGMEVRVDPWSLIDWDESRLGRLRGDATYAYRRTKEEAKAALTIARVKTFGAPASWQTDRHC